MSILIKGMEMPKCCNDCRFAWIDTGHHWYCEANKPWGLDITDHVMSKHPDCPLIEVPKHGRLIDADALMLIIKDYIDEYSDVDTEGYHNLKWCAMKESEMAIEDAPTVIPARDINVRNKSVVET